MDLRVVLLCFVAAYGQSPDYERSYKSEIRSGSDLRGENTNSVPGFVQPLDFSSFTQQFFAGSQNILSAPFSFGSPEVFGAESKKTGVFQTANSDFVPFSGSPFPEDVKTNNTGFVQPVHFLSPFDRDGSGTKIYHHQKPPNAFSKKYPQSRDPMHKAATDHEEDEEETPYSKHIPSPSRPSQSYKQSPKLATLKRDHFGKSSYPSPQNAHKSEHSPSADSVYYLPKHKDVEVFLPKEKLTVLPMVNGRPKPYDGYRAASEVRNYDSYESDDDDDEDDEERDSSGRYSEEGEIIYGKPKPGPENIVPPYVQGRSRIKRSPAEYHGGIYPHYDYSDPKHNKKLEVNEEDKQKKLYPKKHQPEVSEKPYDQYKYPKGNKKVNKTKDNYGHATEENPEEYKESEAQTEEQPEPEQEEQEQEQGEQAQGLEQEQEEEQEQEQEEVVEDIPPITYRYENEFHIPELKVKRYPYETFLQKSAAAAAAKKKRTDSKDNERSSSNYDEFTADYESYKKSLPSDLEKHFGSPDFEERYTVAATENLEKNKNCQKVSKIVTPKEIATGKAKRDVTNNDQQVCYICTDPNTGGSFEQCAYQTDPKSQKFFHGGSSSYKSTDKAEPITYRYRRSPYDDDHFSLEHFIFGNEPHAARRAREDHEYVPKPKKLSRKKYKKPAAKNKAKYKYDGSYNKYDPLAKIIGAPSTYADESARVEGPPESYNGPAYTYEGPSRPYEGPKETYEGPAAPYEGPSEPYEGPINQEYYDLTDDRLSEDDDHSPPSKQESQSTVPRENTYYKKYQKQSKPRGYSVKHVKPQKGPKSEVEEFPAGNYRTGNGFIADYRFGPEHFEEDEEVEPTRQNDEIRPPKKVKSTEKRGPHKFTQDEEKTPASSDAEEVGHVKVYKNGDVCQKKKKDGMICMVCLNEKTSASYEQCQYSSKPKDKYYTFGSQKSYKSNKAPSDRHERNAESDQYPEKSDIVEKKILIRKESKIFGDDAGAPESLIGAESRGYDRFKEFLLSGDLVGAYSENDETQINQNDTSDEDGSKNTETIERIEPRDEVEGLDEFLYGAADNDKKATDDKAEYKSYDDYFSSLFPDFAKNEEKSDGDSDTEASFDPFENIREFKVYEPEEAEEVAPVDVSDSPKHSEASNDEPVRLKDQGSRIPSDFFEPYSEEHKKDLEKALGEFQNKDWSNCKKIVKNRLTCYQCVDKHGVSNEECMYVESSQPVSKHLAYHEKKELRPEIPASKEEAESQKNEQAVAPTTEKITTEPNQTNEEVYRRVRKPKNSRPEIIEVSEAPEENEESVSTKGDLEGLSRSNVDEITFTTYAPHVTYETEPEVTTQKPRIKKNRKNQKKRMKSKKDGNETSTEVARKRKYPIKKFSDQDREILNDSSNLNSEESTRVVNEDDGSVVKIFFNNTEGSTR